MVGEATCTDISPGMVTTLSRNAQRLGLEVRAARADAEALPFADSSFDLVLGHAVLHHLPNLRRAFTEFHRVLRPGGVLGLLWSGPDRSHPGLTELLAVAGPAGDGAADRSRWRQVHLPADAPFSAPETPTVRWTVTVTVSLFTS